MYKYEIWLKNCPGYQTEEKQEPWLWVECKTIKEVGRYLDLTPSQVRERMSWSRNGKLGNVWHVKPNRTGYQILRFRKHSKNV
jgi:hypothetical protein